MSTITLDDIRAKAEVLSRAHVVSTARAALLQEEIKAAIAPIVARHRAGLDAAAEEEAGATATLDALLAAAPQLFLKKRSLTVDGVRCGYRKEEDALDLPEAADLMARIRALVPELALTLIRTQETPVLDALRELPPAALQKLGVRTITGADRRFITIGDSDVEKLAKLVLAAATQRLGEEDAPKAKKGKVKAKEVA